MEQKEKTLRVAFVVGEFPVLSETFIINQIADLVDRGVEVTIFAFKRGDTTNVSDRYKEYDMASRVYYLNMPLGYRARFFAALPKMIHVLQESPISFFRIMNVFRYGKNAIALKNLFWAEPFLGKKFDVVHCHFGPMGNKYLWIKDMLGLKQKLVVTFYGFDVSQIVQQKGAGYYNRLRNEGEIFFTMSENMKSRVVALGFDSAKVVSLPVSIDVSAYPFEKRALPPHGVVNLFSVGRFVEKKGFDDLLRSLALLKKKTSQKFRCYIVGGPKPEEEKLRLLAKELDVEDVVEWKGYMKIEEITQFFLKMHLYVQTSKTAKNGDME